MRKNTVQAVPHDIAKRFGLQNPQDYKFHSFRRGAATAAADGGSTSEQMQDFFGWKNPSMCKEYISTSKAAINSMAAKLGSHSGSFDLGEPEVEVEVAAEAADPGTRAHKTPTATATTTTTAAVMETATATTEGGNNDNMDLQDYDMDMDEDPDMYAAAGLPPPPTAVSADRIESAVRTAITSLPNIGRSNVTVKVVINTGNNVTMNF